MSGVEEKLSWERDDVDDGSEDDEAPIVIDRVMMSDLRQLSKHNNS